MSSDISRTTEIGGFIGACLVDADTGLMLASQGGGKLDLETAAAASMKVMQAKLDSVDTLGLEDYVEDIIITLGKQIHLIRPLQKNPGVFLYVALDRHAANLGLARLQVKAIEESLRF